MISVRNDLERPKTSRFFIILKHEKLKNVAYMTLQIELAMNIRMNLVILMIKTLKVDHLMPHSHDMILNKRHPHFMTWIVNPSKIELNTCDLCNNSMINTDKMNVLVINMLTFTSYINENVRKIIYSLMSYMYQLLNMINMLTYDHDKESKTLKNAFLHQKTRIKIVKKHTVVKLST